MDMLLSDKDGRYICKILKAGDDTRDKKIIMVSAHPGAEKTCRDAGADEFLEKFFDLELFIKKVNADMKT